MDKYFTVPGGDFGIYNGSLGSDQENYAGLIHSADSSVSSQFVKEKVKISI